MMTPSIIKLFKMDVSKEVEDRLKLLRQRPEFEVFAMSESFPLLLMKSSSMKKIVEVPYTGEVLRGINSVVQDSNHLPFKSQVISLEMRSYIANELGIRKEEKAKYAVIKKLRTNQGIVNTQNVLKLLLEYGFTSEQILNGIEVLSFEYTAIKSTLDEFATLPEVQPYEEWMKNSKVIHLLSYLVMKNNHLR